jgi:hypothetical protein
VRFVGYVCMAVVLQVRGNLHCERVRWELAGWVGGECWRARALHSEFYTFFVHIVLALYLLHHLLGALVP